MKGKKMLKMYLVNPIHPNIEKIVSTSSYFIQSFNEIFKDEEYMDENDNIIKCYSCDGEDIIKLKMNFDNFVTFIRNTAYSFEVQEQIIADIHLICCRETYSLIPVSYCKNCNRIMSIFNIPYVFKFGDINEMEHNRKSFLLEDGLIKSNNVFYENESCPRCHSIETKENNVYYDESGTVEYNLFCKNCGYYLHFFSYGSIEYAESAMKCMMIKNNISFI